MFCRYCGKQIMDDSIFCSYWGKSLDKQEKTSLPTEIEILLEEIDNFENNKDYVYYKKRANKIVSYSLQKATKVFCYIALVIFLVFNIKMAPMYGWAKFFFYIGAAVIAIGLIVLFNKKVATGEIKKYYLVYFILALITITSSISLRIIYESKVDYVESQIPSNGKILVRWKKKQNTITPQELE